MSTSASTSQSASSRGAGVQKAYRDARKPRSEVDWKLVEQYMPLVRSLVGRYRSHFPAGTDIEDVTSVALNGLIQAAQRFSPEVSKHFGPFAKQRIRGAILDELRKVDRFSRNRREHLKKIEAIVGELHTELGRMPDEEQVAEKLGLSVEAYRRTLEDLRPIQLFSLESQGDSDDEGPLLAERLDDPTAPDARDYAERHECLELLRKELRSLPERHLKIIMLYHFEGLNLAEIAEVMELTESRICQLHSQAILSLRATLSRLMTNS